MESGEATRVIGTETEYGVYDPSNPGANPVALSALAVDTYGNWYRGDRQPVAWDYSGEDPLNDVRGMRLDRAHAHPSLLTDDPYRLAPSGGAEHLPRPSEAEQRLLKPSSIVLQNGGRFYVDHAHPEYSSPEVADAFEGVLWDRAGDEIAKRAMMLRQLAQPAGQPLDMVLVKNNVDGKGATYGSHENYQVSRMVDLDELIRYLIPFFVTRPVICGAGRVGIGPASEHAGFQISQRADYVENDVGLETTFNRPIFNTRDEPHADHHQWRRIHVIGGDANQFDVSTLLRLGTTALVLQAIERGTDLEWDTLDLTDPVSAVRDVSRDLTGQSGLGMVSGQQWSALDIQERYLDLVTRSFQEHDVTPTKTEQLVLDTWRSVISRMREDVMSVATEVEWVGKYALLERQRERLDTTWDDPRLAAMDLQWADLRPDKSLVSALDRAGLVKRLFTPQQVEFAADNAPATTRAAVRGKAVRERPDLAMASWTSLVFDTPQEGNDGQYVRVPLASPGRTSMPVFDQPQASES